MVIGSEFRTEEPQILGATMQHFFPGGTWHWSCIPPQYVMFWVCAKWTVTHTGQLCLFAHNDIWNGLRQTILRLSVAHVLFSYTLTKKMRNEVVSWACRNIICSLESCLSKFTELRAQLMLGYKRSWCRNGVVICKSWFFVFVCLYLTAFGKYLHLKYEHSVGNARAVGGHCRREQLLPL